MKLREYDLIPLFVFHPLVVARISELLPLVQPAESCLRSSSPLLLRGWGPVGDWDVECWLFAARLHDDPLEPR